MIKQLLLSLSLLLTACAETDSGNFSIGVADGCRAMPAFIAQTYLGSQVALDNQQQGFMGMRLLNLRTKQAWQHPSWDDAGYTGAFARDEEGNIYVAPTPKASLAENPPALQNRIYRIDAKTAEMALWLELPAFSPPSLSNPFGVMGLFYDCDTHSLYASSLAGSTPKAAHGRIYRIDVATKAVLSQLDNVDAFSLGVFNGVEHKRLYFGSARSSEVFSVALDAKGDFTVDSRREFALADLPNGNTTSVRKITFGRNQQGQYLMQLKEAEFGFRLLAENNPYKRMYQFVHQTKQDNWQFLGVQSEGGD